MAFPVSRMEGSPRFDALPVAKVTHYPLEERDYRPFAQNRICAGEEELHVRMWAFEVSPMPASELRCVLYLFPAKPRLAVCLSLFAPRGTELTGPSSVSLLEDGSLIPDSVRDASPWLHPHNGEDLQGVYWGGTFSLPLLLLKEIAGTAPGLETGSVFRGNFYKLCTGDAFAHQGSCFPADFPDTPYGVDSTGEFQVVGY